MNQDRLLRASELWLRLLLRLYPADFRDEMGLSIAETYRDRCRAALRRVGTSGDRPIAAVAYLSRVWLGAFVDSLRNGLGERLRPAIRWRRTGDWGRDAELALRRLVRAPAFVLAMTGTLTVGLAAFAVVYAVVQKVLVAPLPYERPDDLYFVWRDYTWIEFGRGWLGGTDVAALDSAGGAIQDAVGMLQFRATMSYGSSEAASEVAVLAATPGFFDVLGVRPILGRTFLSEEGGPGRSPVIVLGYDLWRERFGGDTGVVGSDVQLEGERYSVIGVMGPWFRFVRHSSLGPPTAADAYTTLDFDLATTNPDAGSYAGLIRARPGTSPAALEAAVAAVGAAVDERDFGSRGLRLYPVGVKADLVEPVRPALVVLGLAGVFLVLVLTVNLATLLLARAAQREREFAISRALGANQMALVRATILEGGLLGLLGGIGGSLAAVWSTRALVALAPLDLPRRESIAVDWGIATVVIGAAALLGLAAGAVPAWWATRTNLASLMSSTSIRGGGGHGRMRRGLVVLQVSLSLVLLSAGGLVVRSFERLLRAEPGFDPAGVLTVRVPLPDHRYPDIADATALHDRLRIELEAIPGVSSVGAASALPLSTDASQSAARFPGSPANTGDPYHDAPLIDRIRVRAAYFDALGIRLLSGRFFDNATLPEAREAVIDHTLAATFFPAGNAVGATMMFGGDTLTVVGVAQHARLYDVHRDDRSQVFVRNERNGQGTLSWALRTTRSPMSLVPEVRAAIRRTDPGLAISEVRSMDQIVSESLRQQRLSAVLISGFALGALVLTAMGLFGVVAGSVTRRRHEIAIRMALGADHGRVLRMVLREGTLLVAGGVVLGAPMIYLAGMAMRGMLVGVSPFDLATLGSVALGLGVVALFACYVPARRVTRIEPARSLGSE